MIDAIKQFARRHRGLVIAFCTAVAMAGLAAKNYRHERLQRDKL